jgi:hypothetical protein
MYYSNNNNNNNSNKTVNMHHCIHCTLFYTYRSRGSSKGGPIGPRLLLGRVSSFLESPISLYYIIYYYYYDYYIYQISSYQSSLRRRPSTLNPSNLL